MRKWNPFLVAPLTSPEPAIPGAEQMILDRQATMRFPEPRFTGNNWTKQLVPAPVEAHMVANYHAHPEVTVQADWTNNDAILLTITHKEVGNV